MARRRSFTPAPCTNHVAVPRPYFLHFPILDTLEQVLHGQFSVRRGFVAPLATTLSLFVAFIVICGLFGLHLNYGINMISGASFYFLASLWFLKRRAKFVDQEHFLEAGLKLWGRPKGL